MRPRFNLPTRQSTPAESRARRRKPSGSTGDEFTIRGFQLDPENSYLRDGLKFSAYSIADLADVEQVEILEGRRRRCMAGASPAEL